MMIWDEMEISIFPKQNLCDRFDYVIGSMNIGLSEEYYKSYEVIDLDYLRPKQTDGNQSDIS